MYIQPCCIATELPPIARQPFAYFQSNGDWLLTDLMASVSQLVPGSVCLITIPEVDVFLLRTLSNYFEKGWFKALLLVTNKNQAALVRNELEPYLDRVCYTFDAHVLDGMFALTNFSRFLAIQGAMLTKKDFTLCQYSSSYGNDAELFKSATEAILPKLKMTTVLPCSHELIVKLLNKKF